MAKKIIKVQLTNKRRITGGYHELAWGDLQDIKKGTINTTRFRDWDNAKKRYKGTVDKFRMQGFDVRAKIIK